VGELGCLFEVTQFEGKPMQFPDATSLDSLEYLEDHDEVVLEAWWSDGENKI